MEPDVEDAFYTGHWPILTSSPPDPITRSIDEIWYNLQAQITPGRRFVRIPKEIFCRLSSNQADLLQQRMA